MQNKDKKEKRKDNNNLIAIPMMSQMIERLILELIYSFDELKNKYLKKVYNFY